MESEVAELKKRMVGVVKEIESFTGLKLKNMPDVDLREQSPPFYYGGKKNLIIWGKKGPMGRPTPERKLVEELTHAILNQNQKEWLPSGLNEYYSRHCAMMLRPPKKEELENVYTGNVIRREIRDIQKFRTMMTLLEKVGIHTNIFVTVFCTTFNKILSETIEECLSDIDFEVFEFFDYWNNPIEYPLFSYYASAKDIARAFEVEEEEIKRSLEKIKRIARIPYGDGTMHSILSEAKGENYMTDFKLIVDWIYEIIDRYIKKHR